jgi:hypothetical protein
MPRVRRLALVAVLAVLGGFALAGCRTEPGVAAYVGDTRVADADVDAVITQFRDSRPPGAPSNFRGLVLTYMVKRELMLAALADRGVDLPAVDVEKYAKDNNLDPQWRFTRVAAEADTYLDAVAGDYLKGRSRPLVPTEADQREAYGRTRVQDQPVTSPFEEVQRFFTAEVMNDALARRDVLAESVKRHPVRLSPRYDGFVLLVPFAVQGATSALGVTVGPAASPSPSSP